MKVHNTVTSVTFAFSFKMKHIEYALHGRTHKPKCFNAIDILVDQESFCQMFRNGKAIATWGHSEKEASAYVSLYQKALSVLGYMAVRLKSSVAITVGTYSFGCRLNLESVPMTYNFLFGT